MNARGAAKVDKTTAGRKSVPALGCGGIFKMRQRGEMLYGCAENSLSQC